MHLHEHLSNQMHQDSKGYMGYDAITINSNNWNLFLPNVYRNDKSQCSVGFLWRGNKDEDREAWTVFL